MSTSTRPLRRDAERNRERILCAARVVFAERGLTATMDEIAHEAGVGVGTVYRRFPEKELLIDALFEDRVDELTELAREALAEEDPWTGLARFLERALELQSGDRALKELLCSTAHGQTRVAHARERIAPLVLELFERAQATGQLRPDVTGLDFPLIQMMVGAIVDFARDVEPEAWRRCLGIVLDGLRTSRDGPSPLAVGPLDLEQVTTAMGCWRPQGR